MFRVYSIRIETSPIPQSDVHFLTLPQSDDSLSLRISPPSVTPCACLTWNAYLETPPHWLNVAYLAAPSLHVVALCCICSSLENGI